MNPTAELFVSDEENEPPESLAHFCDTKILKVLDAAMRELNSKCSDECVRLKKKINPFSSIGKAQFSTRTTVKAANMDSLVHFTCPLDKQERPLLNATTDEFLYTDFYGDRDGFGEYIEWRLRGQGKRARKFNVSAMMSHSRRQSNVSGTINITDQGTIERFVEYVRSSGGKDGLHLVAMEAYPIDYKSEKSFEMLCSQYSLCYCLMALSILRENGTFIMKLFKCLTPFTVGLLYLMYRCFGKITIVKPNSCGQHSAERFLVCKWKLSDTKTDIVRRYLMEKNDRMNEKKRIDWLVPMNVLQADKKFFKFIRNGNIQLSERILLCWQKMSDLQQMDDGKLVDPRANELRERCLKLWNLA